MMQYQDDTDYYTVNYDLNMPRVSTKMFIEITASQTPLIHMPGTVPVVRHDLTD